MANSHKMMHLNSTGSRLDHGSLCPIAGLVFVLLLSVACDGGGRNPTGPTPPGGDSFPPRSLTISSGDGQQGRVNEQLPVPLAVRMTDAEGRPVAGGTVLFQPIAGGGELTGHHPPVGGEPGDATTAVTDGAGVATVFLVLGPQPGSNLVEAGAFFGNSNSVTFSATAMP